MSFLPIGKDTNGLMRELLAMSADVSHVLNDIEAVDVPQVEIGATPKELVLTLDQVTLNHYASQNETTQKARPILITYALVNRPYMLDLQADRSLINHLTRLGYDVYLIDWGYPTRNDRWTTFDDYLMMYVDVCVDTICERHGVEKLNLIGICQGGVMSLCYTATHG
ncbi:MAG: alpha/beta fold hydrolase, partial [Chloroflexota bacterium]